MVFVWGWKRGHGGGKRWGDGCGMMGYGNISLNHGF